MAIAKVILNGTTQIDLTQDTVDASNTVSGITGHKNDGASFTGTITPKSSSDITVSGDTVTVPAGNYASSTSKSVASGTAGTPTATKGTVSGNAVSVTPSVTNVTGYITGGTKTGTAVTVSASELVSGTYNVTSSGTKDVTNYASASVPSGSASPASTISATGATVSTGTNTLTLSKSVSNTPTVSAGYISSGTAGNSSVSLTATVTTKAAATITPTTSNQTIASGTYLTGAQTISGDANLVAGNIKKDVSIFGVTGTLEGSSKNAQIASGVGRVNTTAYTAVSGQSLTVAKTGTYDVYWTGYRSSTSGTNGSQLYVGDTAHSSGAQTTFNGTYTNVQNVHLSNVSLTKDQTVSVYARARGTTYYMYVMNLTIIEA